MKVTQVEVWTCNDPACRYQGVAHPIPYCEPKLTQAETRTCVDCWNLDCVEHGSVICERGPSCAEFVSKPAPAPGGELCAEADCAAYRDQLEQRVHSAEADRDRLSAENEELRRKVAERDAKVVRLSGILHDAEATPLAHVAIEMAALRENAAGAAALVADRDATIAAQAARVEELEAGVAAGQRVARACSALSADLREIGRLCKMRDDEYPLKAVQRVVATLADEVSRG